ncbi:MAG: outer membrane protein assembly factor BamE [Pseudomonadota bacterium]
MKALKSEMITPPSEAPISDHAVASRASNRPFTPRPTQRSMHRLGAPLAAVLIGLAVAGCGATVTKHGHHLRPTDVQQVQPGMTSDEVQLALGTPATTSRTPRGETYYYISSTTKQQAFFLPQEVDRKVLAVYFTPLGSVQRVANYGLQDGKVFDLVTRKTPAANTAEDTLLQTLLRNIGRRRLSTEG